MEIKDVGRIIGATALAVIPAAGGLYAFGAMKDRRQNTAPAALVGGLTATLLGVGVALANYYMLGLDETAAQITQLIGEKQQQTVGAVLRPTKAFSSSQYSVAPPRVFSPFSSNFRQVGMLDVRRVGCCGR